MKHWHILEHINAGNAVYAVWTAFLSFLAPMGCWLSGCAFMVFMDFITGCWAARKRGEMWSSVKFRNSISKCGSYMFVIICARVVENMLPSYIEFVELTKMFAGFIVGVEFYSVLENFYKATGNKVFYILTQITSRKLKDSSGFSAEEAKERK